ncbi:GDYXXLXY domain-containing protein [Woodsholea maritima]|uniref:GDYXXLXY domain-containing protein n=1 Tax=Woodsholea maritima TaxID=240237 RepID=UPI000377C7F9|nr:GDYXXLXY domain-containing protein [Woodsholea maritima]
MIALIRLIALGLAACALLGSLVYIHAKARAEGDEIILSMEPVDPRDVLLGHYIQIRTPLHQLDTKNFLAPKRGWKTGDTVYVRIAPGPQGRWQAVELYMSPPAQAQGLVVQGQVSWVRQDFDYEEVTPTDADAPGGELEAAERPIRRRQIESSGRDVLNVIYTIERYYADRETALALEALRNEDRVQLIASVGAEGRIVIKGLVIDGERHIDSLF